MSSELNPLANPNTRITTPTSDMPGTGSRPSSSSRPLSPGPARNTTTTETGSASDPNLESKKDSNSSYPPSSTSKIQPHPIVIPTGHAVPSIHTTPGSSPSGRTLITTTTGAGPTAANVTGMAAVPATRSPSSPPPPPSATSMSLNTMEAGMSYSQHVLNAAQRKQNIACESRFGASQVTQTNFTGRDRES